MFFMFFHDFLLVWCWNFGDFGEIEHENKRKNLKMIFFGYIVLFYVEVYHFLWGSFWVVIPVELAVNLRMIFAGQWYLNCMNTFQCISLVFGVDTWADFPVFPYFAKLPEDRPPRPLGRFRWPGTLWKAPEPYFKEKYIFNKKRQVFSEE